MQSLQAIFIILFNRFKWKILLLLQQPFFYFNLQKTLNKVALYCSCFLRTFFCLLNSIQKYSIYQEQIFISNQIILQHFNSQHGCLDEVYRQNWLRELGNLDFKNVKVLCSFEDSISITYT